MGHSEWRALGQVRPLGTAGAQPADTLLGAVAQDVDAVDEFFDAFTNSTPAWDHPDDELVATSVKTGSYMVHNVSLFYEEDNWTLGMGVRNLEDKRHHWPTQVRSSVLAHVQSGWRLHVLGRTFFVNAFNNFDIGLLNANRYSSKSALRCAFFENRLRYTYINRSLIMYRYACFAPLFSSEHRGKCYLIHLIIGYRCSAVTVCHSCLMAQSSLSPES